MMHVDPAQAALVIVTPAAAMLIGSAAGLWRSPGPRLRSGFQHFAAGIIFAAVATELVPSLVAGPSWVAMAIGFTLGVVFMLGIRAVAQGEDDESQGAAPKIPVGMIAAIGTDLFIDGLLVALALGVGEQGGLVLAAGVSFETLFLGLALAATLSTQRKLLLVTALLTSFLLVLGGGLGIAILGWVSEAWRLGLLAFGTAALLYVVTEELLVEAHKGKNETTIGSAVFFVGFGLTLAIAAAA